MVAAEKVTVYFKATNGIIHLRPPSLAVFKNLALEVKCLSRAEVGAMVSNNIELCQVVNEAGVSDKMLHRIDIEIAI